MDLTPADVENWLERYRRAWEDADTEGVVDLFTEDATYRSNIFAEPDRGHDGVRSYWQGATGTQSEVSVRMGKPFIDGNRVAAEWWTTMRDSGEEITLPGCLLLEFAPDGRCSSLREYWQVAEGRLDPPEEWGR